MDGRCAEKNKYISTSTASRTFTAQMERNAAKN